MADFYWVGGNGTWDSTSTTHWSTTSGGAGGAGVPTAADNVRFDAGSVGAVNISGTVYCFSLYIYDVVGLTFTSSVGAKINAYKNVSNWLENNNSLYLCDLTVVLLNTAVVIQTYTSDTIYPIKNIEASGFYSIIYHTKTGCLPITLCDMKSAYVELYVRTKDLTISCNNALFRDVIVHRALTVTKNLSTSGTITLDQDVLISGMSSLSVSITTGYALDVVKVAKGTIIFSGGGSMTELQTDVVGTAATTLMFSPSSSLKITNFNVGGNATRNVTISSSTSGTRAVINYLGTQRTIHDVSVQDIQIAQDDKIISYTSDSINMGNNWQWYFDSFKKPIRNLFFGSHV